MMKIANAQLWVHDQDEARDFYTQKLGMEVRADVTLPEIPDFRWLTVGPVDQPDFAIVLMAIVLILLRTGAAEAQHGTT